MIAFIETKITRVFGKVPSKRGWFAASSSDAIASGRFDETTFLYEAVYCDDSRDADMEVKRRREKLIETYTDRPVWFDVTLITEAEFDFQVAKEEAFERKFAV